VLRLGIDSRLEDVALIGYAVRGVCQAKGMPVSDMDDVELAVCESVNNVVRHSHDCQPGKRVEVVIGIEDRHVVIDVMDCAGPEFPVEPQEPSCVDDLPEGALGVYIIHSLMDTVEHVEHIGRIALRMIKRYR
jgi:serine/threonine-protein kinase RsbW